MKLKFIVYFFICSMQCIIASDTQLNTKRKIIHTTIENKTIRCRTSARLKEDNVVIAIPTSDALKKRFKEKNYHSLIKDTPILAQLTSKHQTCLTTYQIIDEICNQFYPYTSTETFLTKLYHRDEIVRIVLKDHPTLMSKLQNSGKILENFSMKIKTRE